ncbi:hypothetical protein SELMODRAFT_123482 [Selaginella moellendorffii]|uniref:Pentacotripeptide-repeat region of PRORP domain-containing protein n=1 Tax=Selaginella moellendorffii TaxID=88036 RepID=D8SRS8_SELML|nr:hypothetical protein SELMODRAFT_123482 [Selaginella moellendorffii]
MFQLWRIARALGFEEPAKRSLGDAIAQNRFSCESEVQQCARILTSCAKLKDLARGREIHARILQGKHRRNVFLSNLLITMYGKCGRGCLDQSRELFNSLESRDLSSWTAMIEAHACNGQSKEALETFWQMNQDGIDADEITFISVLHSCSHTGMVEKSLHQFVSMSSDHATEVKPALEHYHCIVDVLCRAGHLEEAEELVTRMPLEPDCVPWTTLLGGCRTHGDLERGSRVASKVFEMDPRAAAHYMLLCNIYVEGEVS